MDAAALLSLLGRRADDPEVAEAFARLRSLRRPELHGAFRDWVLVRRQGVELGFVDEEYHFARAHKRRVSRAAPLILSQVYFYGERDGVTPFAGALPFGVEWSNAREGVREKLARYEPTRRSYLSDDWRTEDFRLSTQYAAQGARMSALLCRLEPSAWPEQGRVAIPTSAERWLDLLGEPVSSSRLTEALGPLELPDELDADSKADFAFECGLVLGFAAGKAKAREPLLDAVHFLAAREEDARAWAGELPLGLAWDDTPQLVLDKLGAKAHDDDPIAGHASRSFATHAVEVVYSNVDNALRRVVLQARGTAKRA